LVFEISERVWKRTDCTACGNCCREVSANLSENDVERLGGHLGLNRSEFASKYLKQAENGVKGDVLEIVHDWLAGDLA